MLVFLSLVTQVWPPVVYRCIFSARQDWRSARSEKKKTQQLKCCLTLLGWVQQFLAQTEPPGITIYHNRNSNGNLRFIIGIYYRTINQGRIRFNLVVTPDMVLGIWVVGWWGVCSYVYYLVYMNQTPGLLYARSDL